MVVHGLLIEIGILGLGVNGKEELGKLEHVVGVTGLRSLTVLNVALVVCCSREVLAAAVTAYYHRAVVGHTVPEAFVPRFFAAAARGASFLIGDSGISSPRTDISGIVLNLRKSPAKLRISEQRTKENLFFLFFRLQLRL